MTPDMQQPRNGYGRPPEPRPAAAPGPENARTAGVIPLLAVLIVAVAGVFVAWYLGSAGGGTGGVLAGVALLAGAAARLLLPPRLAGLLVVRKRATDVLTLTVCGIALIVVGLVLPR
jgi:hypothetical protein